MNCKRFESLLEQYLTGVMDAGDRAALEEHLKGCARCRLRLEVLKDCRRINEDDEVPAHFSQSWRHKIQEEEGESMKKTTPVWTRWLAAAAVFVVLIAGTWLTGNELNRMKGRQSADYAGAAPEGGLGYYAAQEDAAYSADYEKSMAPAAMPMARGMAADAEESAQTAQQKIIRTIRISSATRNFDEDYQTIKDALNLAGGRVESADVRTGTDSLRTLYLTLRVPAERLDTFAGQLKGLGHLQSFNESSEDVSEQYFDTQSRLKTQQAKMERLTALMEKALNVEDLVAIESAIADTQYLIDSYTGQLKGIDSRASEATLAMTLSEMSPLDTAEAKEETIWKRIASGIVHMWGLLRGWAADAAVFLVAALPVIALIALAGLVIKMIIKRRNKKQ